MKRLGQTMRNPLAWMLIATILASGCEDNSTPPTTAGADRQAAAPEPRAPKKKRKKRPSSTKKKKTARKTTAVTAKKKPKAAPAVNAAKAALKSMDNLQKIGGAMKLYELKHGHLPPGVTLNKQGGLLLSWRVELLPFLGHQDLYKKFNRDKAWDSAHNKPLLSKIPAVFQCPNLPVDGRTNYLAPVAKGTVLFHPTGRPMSEITDDHSQTIVVLEADADRAVEWTRPRGLIYNANDPMAGLGGLRPEGILALMANQGVTTVQHDTAPKVMTALIMPADGRKIALDEFTSVDDPALSASGQSKRPPALGPFARMQAKANSRKKKPSRGARKRRLSYLQAAASLAKAGDIDAASKLVCASALLKQDDSVEIYLRWCPALKRPVVALKWGLGAAITLPRGGGNTLPNVRWAPNDDIKALKSRVARSWHYTTGRPGRTMISELKKRMYRGDFGQIYVLAEQASGASNRLAGSSAVPGVSALTSGDSSTVTQAARAANVDLLIRMDLAAVKEGDGGWYTDIVVNTSLSSLRGGGSLTKLPTLITSQVQKARTRGKPDPVASMVARLMKYIDKNVKLGDFPEMTEKQVFARAKSLPVAAQRDQLLALCEAFLYFRRGQINEKQLAYVYKKILGDRRAEMLTSSDVSRRRAVLQQLLPAAAADTLQ